MLHSEIRLLCLSVFPGWGESTQFFVNRIWLAGQSEKLGSGCFRKGQFDSMGLVGTLADHS